MGDSAKVDQKVIPKSEPTMVPKKRLRNSNTSRNRNTSEQHSKTNNMFITGLQIKLRSKANAANANRANSNSALDPVDLDGNTVGKQLENFLKSNGIFLEVNNMKTRHPLPLRGKIDKPASIIKFIKSTN